MTSYNVRDAELSKSKALPAAASASIYTDGIDLGALSAKGVRIAGAELLVTAPALTGTMLPAAKTMTYTVQHDDDPAFGTVATLQAAITQTGTAVTGGAAATTKRIAIPSDAKRYVRLQVTSGADVTDSSAVSAKLEVLS